MGRRVIFVNPSERWCNPARSSYIARDGKVLRPQICRTLDLASTAEPALEKLSAQLNEAHHRVAANLSTNPDARIEQVNGKDRLTLTGLDKLDEPPSLIALREQVDALLPRIDDRCDTRNPRVHRIC